MPFKTMDLLNILSGEKWNKPNTLFCFVPFRTVTCMTFPQLSPTLPQ